MSKSARVVLIVGWLSASAFAGFTPVSMPAAGELGWPEMLEGIYSPGTAWALMADGVSYSNGTLQALRADDFGLSGPLDANLGSAGSATDQLWTGDQVSVRARARFAANEQIFGYEVQGDATGTQELFAVTGSGLSVGGSATLNAESSDSWVWVRSGEGGAWKSADAQNSEAADHMITFQLTGFGDGQNHWLLGVEDIAGLGDRDYNDLVVEIASPLPEPASALLLGLAALLRRKGR